MDLNNYIEEQLKDCRKTMYRKKIIEILKMFEVPATVDDILSIFVYSKEHISQSTIYRNLEILTNKGIVNKSIAINGHKTTYELNKPVKRHFITCIKCNKIKPVIDATSLNIKDSIVEKSGFTIIGYKFEIYGYCQDCHKNIDINSTNNLF